MAGSRQYTALEWVVKEINVTLQESQRVLENYANDPQDVTQLRFCQTLIHQVFGSLRMVGFHGAAMLAEEMEALAQALLDGEVRDSKEALEVLMGAILQLPDYLEQVQQTKQDYPALVLSLLNDIRSVRGASLLSESTLFAPNLDYAHQIHGKPHPISQDNQQLQVLVGKLRQMYQYAAASIFHNINVDENLAYLQKASERLHKLLHGTRHEAVWEIAGAVIDGLHKKIINPSPSVKNLLRDLDGQLKQIEAAGTAALEEYPSDELLKNLLYYISTSNTQSDAINGVKERYQLSQMMPLAAADTDQQAAPPVDMKTMRAVGAAIREEFSAIKVHLDNCLDDDNQHEHLDFIQNALQRVNDTLAILGVGDLRQAVNNTLISIAAMRQQGSVVTRDQLLDAAHNIADIEVRLDRALSSTRLPGGSTYQLDEAQTAVLEECRNGLETAKDSIVDYIASQWDPDTIKPVPDMLRQVRGSLLILSLTRAADILSACILYIETQLIKEAIKPKWQQLDSLADVIASVDYYLEFMSAARENDLSILDKAEKGLGLLGVAKANVQHIHGDKASVEEPVSPAPAAVAEPIEDDEQDDIDAEVAEIFVEEFYEIKERLEEFFPQWANNFDDEAALAETRRAFHTLKGSGRMVKATDIGELAWSVENMLNRILDYTIPASKVQAVLIDKVLAILPDMITAYQAHASNPHQELCDQYMTWAQQLTLNEDVAEVELALLGSDDAPQDESSEQEEILDSSPLELAVDNLDANSDAKLDAEPEEIDAQLWEIFKTEAEGHLAVVQEFIDAMEKARPFYEPPSDAMQRALHTLKGSAHMAELTPIAELMTPLEQFAKELRSYQVIIDDDIFQLVKDGVTYTYEALEQIEQLQYPEIPKYEQFVARLTELRERSVGPLIRQKEAEKADQKVDPAILEVLMTEEMTLLMDADLMVEQWQQNSATAADWQPLFDELVKLTHGAERANLPTMVNLSKALESVYQQLIGGTIAPSDEVYSALMVGHLQLMDIIDSIAAGQDLPEENNDLLARLTTLSDTNNSDLDSSLEPINSPEPINSLEPINSPEPINSLEPVNESSELNASHQFFESPQPNQGKDSVEEQGKPAAEIDDASGNLNDSFDSATDSSDEELHVEDDEVDEETIEIFLEEAHELLEDLDESIHEWENGADDRESNEQMQRALHTFKGGARLAGLGNLGDLSHNFEAYLIANSKGEQAENIFSEIHHYQDQLISQVAAVLNPHQEEAIVSESDIEGLDQSIDAPEETSDLSGSVISGSANDAFETTPEQNDSLVDSSSNEEVQGLESGPELEPEPESTVPSKVQPLSSVSASPTNVLPFSAKPSPLEVLREAPKTASTTASTTMAPASQSGNAAAARRNQPQEVVKVSADLMEELVNLAGETSISRGRMEEQISELGYSLDEMGMTVQRLQEQLRRLDIETDAQIVFRQEQMEEAEEFDPLEMDRYSQLQQLSRSLIESASDLMDLKSTLIDKTRDAETVLLQQSRINTDLQEGLMRSRMVPFSRIVPRLRRIVRQIATELQKEVNLELGNIEGELDRSMMERMVAPLEHMLRNAIDHGIEDANTRQLRGKPASGRIVITLDRDGGDVLIHVADDGGGIDVTRVKAKAIERHLMTPDADLTDQEILQFILHAGFSTAETITQISGRGVGMDVVNSEIRQMGGSVAIDSRSGEGTAFTIRVPFTVSVNRALMVNMAEDRYAIPLNTIEGIVRISPYELEHYYSNPDEPFEYAGQNYQLRYLGTLLDKNVLPRLQGHTLPLPVLLVRSADHSVALQVDNLQGSREIVVKSLGPQFKSVQGVSGATIMGDGHVVVILDLNALIRSSIAQNLSYELEGLDQVEFIEPAAPDRSKLVMVVDDSVTVRKVTTRLLEREGYDVITAKDGVDAMNTLQDTVPDIMLLDIEMPRMDGFEVAKNVRSSSVLNQLPIIMITSRTGEKHRQRGLESGANRYMGKPYQEELLLESIRELTRAHEHSNA